MDFLSDKNEQNDCHLARNCGRLKLGLALDVVQLNSKKREKLLGVPEPNLGIRIISAERLVFMVSKEEGRSNQIFVCIILQILASFLKKMQ